MTAKQVRAQRRQARAIRGVAKSWSRAHVNTETQGLSWQAWNDRTAHLAYALVRMPTSGRTR
ncbi:hypothetical protein J2S57_005079 [Kineosporia succinea]|uniref:Uncharacterized protein n=1 Tax=Kineosporia succinea TaxID=84632 RepID=A0ABT9P9F8_9ACTN|nr:hypothetical protein [Kineosporia succinea]